MGADADERLVHGDRDLPGDRHLGARVGAVGEGATKAPSTFPVLATVCVAACAVAPVTNAPPVTAPSVPRRP